MNTKFEQKIKNEVFYNVLVSMGTIFELDIYIDIQRAYQQLQLYNGVWKHYNPLKPHIPRFGLSLTSIDGGLSGVPDLGSLIEYNEKMGTDFSEKDFNKFTPVFDQVPALREPLFPFFPHLGRSHLIKLDEGGFFPFHRDSPQFGADSFRLISLLHGASSDCLCFIHNNQKITLEQGRLYFLNTRMSHALFSFANDVQILVLNVILSEESLALVYKHSASK